MTFEEFEKEIITFTPEKDNLTDKVNDLFAKGAGLVHVLYFIIEHKSCGLTEAKEIVDTCPDYHKRFEKINEQNISNRRHSRWV